MYLPELMSSCATLLNWSNDLCFSLAVRTTCASVATG